MGSRHQTILIDATAKQLEHELKLRLEDELRIARRTVVEAETRLQALGGSPASTPATLPAASQPTKKRAKKKASQTAKSGEPTPGSVVEKILREAGGPLERDEITARFAQLAGKGQDMGRIRLRMAAILSRTKQFVQVDPDNDTWDLDER